MGKILLITNTSSTLFFSMKERLEELNHQMVIMSPDGENIQKCGENTDAFLLYLDEEILSNPHILIEIRDMAIEGDIDVFLIGYEEYFESAREVLPSHIIRHEFFRPINVKIITEEVVRYINKKKNSDKKKILVVDDSGTMLRNIKAWLGEKYQVILANSATMAIKYLAKEIPDLILLDYEMPVCDGGQLFRMLRAETEFEHIPIFFLTGKNDRQLVSKLLALSPEGYLLKTMQPEDVVKTVDAFFLKQEN